MSDTSEPPRGHREELYTTRQIAEWFGWRASSVPKEMHRAGIDAVSGYPARAVRRWAASRPGKGNHARPDRRYRPGDQPRKQRGPCSVCGRDVAATPLGDAYKHLPAQGTQPAEDGLCPGSWQPVTDQEEAG